jgi:hypothetical protein
MSDNKFFAALQKYCMGRGLKLNEDQAKEDLSVDDNASQSSSDSRSDLVKASDYKEKITTEIVMRPHVPDAHGHWYTPETIRKGQQSADKAWKEGRLSMNLFHEADVPSETLELLSHSVTDFDCEVNGELIKEGTWVARVKWNDETLFKMRTETKEDGLPDVAGLSPKCKGVINPPKIVEEETNE